MIEKDNNEHSSNCDKTLVDEVIGFSSPIIAQNHMKHNHNDSHSSISSVSHGKRLITTSELKKEIKEKLLIRKVETKMKFLRNKKPTKE